MADGNHLRARYVAILDDQVSAFQVPTLLDICRADRTFVADVFPFWWRFVTRDHIRRKGGQWQADREAQDADGSQVHGFPHW